ncbi:translation elongation factor 2 [Bellilinea caldifistulae]|uniref:Elongation factor G n=1 Tax=Bellilinea caldifistulae TaxID=360411 RepID=A0A0P6X066_9CHLR|nr:elongation factor G [Bellilinea caldifistulae]KPL74208.1 elongation factor G [Bellilinea caldifistulae]GAP10393.1 translation elongation factor 2 [Bellilinea caldifistulae]
MKEYTTESIRNIALASHSSAGKTMLAEAMLHLTGATTRLGRVEDGTTISDFDEEEIRRGISLYTSVLPVEYRDVKINLLDTPGYTDFIGEVISALRVADGAIIVVDSVAGAEVGTEIAWNYCNTFQLPRFVVINKMDRDNANFQKALASIQNLTETRLIPVQLPWGEKASFQGVIDLITMKAYKGDGKTIVDIPAEYRSAAEEARFALVEAAAEGEDELLEKYLESGELSNEEVVRGLKAVIRQGSFVPVFATSATTETGIFRLLDAIVDFFPSPAEIAPVKAIGKNGEEELLTASDSGPLAAYVWKTTADPFVGKQTFFRVYSGMVTSDSRVWNQNKGVEERFGTVSIPRGKENIPVKVIHSGDIGVVPKLSETVTGNTLGDKAHPLTLPVPEYPNALYRVAIFPKTQADSTKISPTLTRLCEEDMTLSWYNEPATLQTILQGMGDQHIDVAIRRAETKFQVNLLIGEPKVPYQETITRKATAMYRHKKQTGGAGQFGEVHLRVEPLADKDFDFTWEVFGGAISQTYAASIQKGIQNVMKEGVLAGYPIRGVLVAVYDGKEHPVDSKPVAFEIAGREAFKLAFKDAGPVLYEPIMNVQIIVPEENMGDVLGDLNTRRARVQGMNTEKGRSVITATVPLAEMLRYTTQLRSLTGGRGIFNMELAGYEMVPPHIQAEIVAQRQKELAEKREE